MKLQKNIETGALLFYCRIFNKRKPIFVSWALTHRCNHHCKYCDIPTLKTKELTRKQIFRMIDELSEMSNKMIVFTGGECLLREDMGEIVDYCKSKGIYVAVSSNGDLIRSKIKEIKNADMLQLSFDGPKEIHDKQRGKGSYDAVLEAIKIAKKGGIKKIVLNVTLTRHNCRFIDYIIRFAEEHGVELSLEPVAYMPLGKRNVRDYLMSKKERGGVFDYLIKKKKSTKAIGNTTSGLEYFRDYPRKEIIKCGAFKVNCMISPDGDIYPCTFLERKIKPYNAAELGFREAFMRSKPVNCDSCLCNKTLDLSKLFSLDMRAIIEIINLSLK